MGLFSTVGGFIARSLPKLGLDKLGIVGDISSTLGGFLDTRKPDYKGIAEYQNAINKKAIDNQLAANLSLADHQYSLNRQAIQDMNEYNSPRAQMQRLKDAGLNPHLIYGSSPSGAAGTQTQYAEYNSPQVPLQQMSNHKMLELENYQIVQDMQLREEQIRNMSLKNDYQEVKNDIQEQSAGEIIRSYKIINDYKQGLISLSDARKKLYVGQEELLSFQLNTELAKQGKLHEETQKIRAYRDKILPQEVALLGQYIDKQKQLIESLKYKNHIDKNTLAAQIKIIADQAVRSGFETTIMQHKSLNWESFGQENSLYTELIRNGVNTLTSEGLKLVFNLLETYLTGGASAVTKLIEQYDSDGSLKHIITETKKTS